VVLHGDIEENGVKCEDCFYYEYIDKDFTYYAGSDERVLASWGLCHRYPKEIKKYEKEWCEK